MKILCFLIVVVSCAVYDVRAQSARLEWAKFLDFENDPQGRGDLSKTYVDFEGNMYVYGLLEDSITDFDPGPGTAILRRDGFGYSGFLAKYTSSGSLSWAKKFAAKHSVYLHSVIRVNDTLYITASHSDTVDMDPGPGIDYTHGGGLGLISIGEFIVRLNTAGEYLGAMTWSAGRTVLSDPEGDLVFVNYSLEKATVDTLTYVDEDIDGDGDIIVWKFDPATQHVKWVKGFTGEADAQFCRIHAAAIDSSGNIYIVGEMDSTSSEFTPIDFDPDRVASVFLRPIGRTDVYILKLSKDGEFIWVKHLGGKGFEHVEKIAVDPEGNSYIAGTFTDSLDFDPGPNVALRNSSSLFDADGYLLKLDANGDFKWVHHISSDESDAVNGVNVGPNRNVIIGGYFYNTVDFDPSPTELEVTSRGRADAFFQSLDPLGSSQWVSTISGPEWQEIESFGLDGEGRVYARGQGSPDTDFDPCAQMFAPAASSSGAFLMKLEQSPLPCPTSNVAQSDVSRRDILVVPQPSTGRFSIVSEVGLHNASVKLIDVHGVVVQEWSGISGEASTLDLVAPAGVYTVEVSHSDGRVQYTKLVKQ